MVGKLLVKNTLKLVLLLGVEMHLDLNNHNEDKLNVPKITNKYCVFLKVSWAKNGNANR